MATRVFSARHWLIVLLGLIFVSYTLFQSRFLILGPRVWIESHADGSVVTEPLINLSGKASNAAWLSLNGEQIYTDEDGLWHEKLLVQKGTSIITLSAQDRFGRTTERHVQIILN
jgi:hypothetical protein